MNWQEVCTNPALQNLPYKMELNRQGQIIMSPASVRHVIFQKCYPPAIHWQRWIIRKHSILKKAQKNFGYVIKWAIWRSMT